MFDDTILVNIRMARLGATNEEVEAAADQICYGLST
jgi:ABC-type multidrug transport system fused ATPase/permease subunit